MRHFMSTLVLVLAAVLMCLPALAQQDVITTPVGGGPNGIPAVDANLYSPVGVAADKSGNYYISAYYQNRIFKVDSTGKLTVVAGSGAQGFSGDGVSGGAGTADLYHPFGVAVDSTGNVYFADQGNCVVRKVDTTNTIKTIAGIGNSCGYSGDGGSATSAQLYSPSGVALDGLGNLFIADTTNCRVREVVLATGKINAFAGNGTCGFSGNTGTATTAEVYYPYGVAADSTGNVFIADTYNFEIREVAKATGKINAVAGNNTYGFGGDGAAATNANISYVYSVAVDGSGNITIADYQNQRIRQFTVGGNINTVAGTGSAGFSGDGHPAISAQVNSPQGVGVSGSNIYVADTSNYRIREFTVGGNINTVAGNGSYNLPTLLTGMPPQGVVFYYPFGVMGDASGDVFVNDGDNYLVREFVKSTNLVNFYAGTGTSGFTGDGGPASSAQVNYNQGVAQDSKGNIYIADTYNCEVRMVNPAGTITAFAGRGQHCGFAGDGGPATSAELYYPGGVAVDSNNNVYIADTYNHVIREVSSGTITTIAGIGQRNGYSGDGGPATSAMLFYPNSVSVDGAGDVFIADSSNCRVREVSAATGNINTVAGNGSCSYTGDGVAIQLGLNTPQGIWSDPNGNLFISDTYNLRLRWVNPQGIMTTFAGTGAAGYFGDAGPATSAQLYYPTGIYEDASGNFLVADQYNFRIRGVSAFAGLGAAPGSESFPITSVGSTSSPENVTISAVGPLTISDITVSGPFSEVDNCPAALANATTCTMDVYFSPTASGNATGTVTITHNGFFSPTSTISLSGPGAAMSLSGVPVNFGNQVVKTTSATKTITVTNTGTTAVTMGSITLNETTDFAIVSNTCPASGSKLNGGANCAIGVTFTPASTGTKRGTVIINDSDPGSPQLAGLAGAGISSVALTPTLVTFPSTAIGVTSAAMKVTVTNNNAGSITLGTPAVTVTAPFLNATGTTCTNGKILASKATCFINITFKPTATGLVKGTVSVADNDPTSPQTSALRGTGTGIKFSPASVNFGAVNRGTTVSSTITVYNVGTTTVTFTGGEISGPNSADFGQSGGNPPCSGSLKAGANCTFSVNFDPTKDATENATYKLYDNSPGSPQSLPMTGKGQN